MDSCPSNHAAPMLGSLSRLPRQGVRHAFRTERRASAEAKILRMLVAATFALCVVALPTAVLATSPQGSAAALGESDAAMPGIADGMGGTESGAQGGADRGEAPEELPPDHGFTAPVAASPEVMKDPAGEFARGEAFLRLGQPAQAARAFRMVIQADPNHLRAHEDLRRAYVMAQRVEGLDDVLAALTKLYVDAKNAEKANQRFSDLMLLNPNHIQRHDLEVALGRVGSPKQVEGIHILDRLRSAFGIVVLLGIAFLLSNNRKRVSLRIVAWGLSLQAIFAVLILWTPPGRITFEAARTVIEKILSFTDSGAEFIFGKLYKGLVPGATDGPMQLLDGASGDPTSIGLVFAFHVLPTIVFFGALMSVLYHLGLIQRLVRGIALLMSRTMGTSGAESLSAAGNIFVGQTEAPLLIKPYVEKMTVSELMAIMCGGFATVAGGVMAAYVRFGLDAGHLLAASVMSAPAALVVAKILYPETEKSATAGGAMSKETERPTSNVIDAAAAGASDGLHLAMNVGAMVMAFIALVTMLNWGLDQVGLSLKQIFGTAFYPLSWCMGVDTKDLMEFGHLLGTKISINEFVAYADLISMRNQLSERTITIATYALCGFANFASIGVQIGGISAIAPSRRSDLAKIGLKAMFGGAIASWLTACVAGVLL